MTLVRNSVSVAAVRVLSFFSGILGRTESGDLSVHSIKVSPLERALEAAHLSGKENGQV